MFLEAHLSRASLRLSLYDSFLSIDSSIPCCGVGVNTVYTPCLVVYALWMNSWLDECEDDSDEDDYYYDIWVIV